MTEALTALVAAAAGRTGLPLKDFQIRTDDDDRQTLLFWYPTATPTEAYVRPVVKLSQAQSQHSIRMRRRLFDRMLMRTHQDSI